MQFEVTQEHIDAANRARLNKGFLPSTCPVAQALGCDVGLSINKLYELFIREDVYKVSARASARIRKWDRGEGMEPFRGRARRI